MTCRRSFIVTMGMVGGAMMLTVPISWGFQWPERPTANKSSGPIAARNEPGAKLFIAGRVFQADGRTPAANVIVYAYHTDVTGLYRPDHYTPDWQTRRPRLEGTVRSAADGCFEFSTIRPAPYPKRTNPAHVHFVLWWPDGHRQSDTLWFEGDPLLTSEARARNVLRAEFAHIRPVKVTSGTQSVEIRFRKHAEGEESW